MRGREGRLKGLAEGGGEGGFQGGVGWGELGPGLEAAWSGLAESLLELIEGDVAGGVGGTEGGSERGGIGYSEAMDWGTKDVGKNLRDGRIFGGTASEKEAGGGRADPATVEAKVEGLALDGGAGESEPLDGYADGEATSGTARGDLGLLERKDYALGRRSGVDRSGEGCPIGEAELAADGVTGKGSIADADETHATAHGIAEGVAEAGGVGADALTRGEERVTGAEADHDLPWEGGPHADEARGIVATAHDDLATRRESVSGDHVSGDGADDGGTWNERGKAGGEAGGGGGERSGGPDAGGELHQVHASAVTRIDGCITPGQDRGEEGGDDVDARGTFPAGGIEACEAPDLGSGEALGDGAAGEVAGSLIAAECLTDGLAINGGGVVHPDGRGAPCQERGELGGEGSGGVGGGEHTLIALGEVDAAVLLTGDGEGVDLGEVGLGSEAIEGELKSVEPEERVCVDLAVIQSWDKSRGMTTVGEIQAESGVSAGEGGAGGHVDHQGRDALSGKIEAEDARHSAQLR